MEMTSSPAPRATDQNLRTFVAEASLDEIMAAAGALRDQGRGDVVTYSRKVFIPLTQLCRDICRYCTFAKAPRGLARAYLTEDEVLEIARAGAKMGCKEALFTLGDKPEARYRTPRAELEALGCRRRSNIWRACAAACSRRPGCCRTSIRAC